MTFLFQFSDEPPKSLKVSEISSKNLPKPPSVFTIDIFYIILFSQMKYNVFKSINGLAWELNCHLQPCFQVFQSSNSELGELNPLVNCWLSALEFKLTFSNWKSRQEQRGTWKIIMAHIFIAIYGL